MMLHAYTVTTEYGPGQVTIYSEPRIHLFLHVPKKEVLGHISLPGFKVKCHSGDPYLWRILHQEAAKLFPDRCSSRMHWRILPSHRVTANPEFSVLGRNVLSLLGREEKYDHPGYSFWRLLVQYHRDLFPHLGNIKEDHPEIWDSLRKLSRDLRGTEELTPKEKQLAQIRTLKIINEVTDVDKPVKQEMCWDWRMAKTKHRERFCQRIDWEIFQKGYVTLPFLDWIFRDNPVVLSKAGRRDDESYFQWYRMK